MTHPYGSDSPGDQPDHGAGAPAGQPADHGTGAPIGQPAGQGSGAQPNPPAYGGPAPAYGGVPGAPAEAMYGGAAAPGQDPSSGYASLPPSRPATVTIASVLAWIGSVALLLFGALFLGAREIIMGELAGQVPPGMGDAITAFGGFFLVWGLAIATLAVFAFRGAMWAVWVLTVLGGLFALLCLLGVAGGSTESLVPVLWVGASLALYLLPTSRQWYRAKRRLGSGGGEFDPGAYAR